VIDVLASTTIRRPCNAAEAGRREADKLPSRIPECAVWHYHRLEKVITSLSEIQATAMERQERRNLRLRKGTFYARDTADVILTPMYDLAEHTGDDLQFGI